MRPEPLKRMQQPRYPTRRAVLANPELLERHLPPGWRVTRELAASTSLFLAAGLAACRGGDGKDQAAAGNRAVSLVAPIFEHGEGRGAWGCVVVAPPIFLSEEEALQVIREELSAHGVTFTESNVRAEGVTFPAHEIQYDVDENGNVTEEVTESPGARQPYDIDARDPVHGISVEFVSRDDYHALGGPESSSTVQCYDLKEAALDLKRAMEESGRGGRCFGAFYDPLESCYDGEDDGSDRQGSKEESLRLLRAQVKDFVDWLEAQGVI